ncbi:MAG: hypothetical protein ACE5HP_12540 [Gemmatimonadota bacterium]
MSRKPLGILLACLLLGLPAQAAGQEELWREVRQVIRDSYAFQRENLADPPEYVASDGSLEFWSSGGLMQFIPADAELLQYESYNIYPKHIRVIMLADDLAVAHFYAEGSYQSASGPPVPNYLTRATQVFVKEDGKWRVRASHFSPIQGGAGTDANAL